MKTAEQEKLEGYPGHRKPNEKAPKPNYNIPEPPKFLDRVGKRHYYELVKRFGPDGMRTAGESDAPALALIADAYSEFRKCRDLLTDGQRYYDNGGVMKKHPAVIDMQNARAFVLSGYGKFGGTGYDRKNVNILDLLPVESREDKKAKRRAEASLKAKKLAESKNHIKKVANE